MEDIIGATEVDAWCIISSLFNLLRLRINLCLPFALDLRTNHLWLCSAKPIVHGRMGFRLSLLEFYFLHCSWSIREAHTWTFAFSDSVFELRDSDVVDIDTHSKLCWSQEVVSRLSIDAQFLIWDVAESNATRLHWSLLESLCGKLGNDATEVVFFIWLLDCDLGRVLRWHLEFRVVFVAIFIDLFALVLSKRRLLA